MRKLQQRQEGASTIATIIILAVLAYGVFIGIQYAPQLIESRSIDSILDTIESQHKSQPFGSVEAVNASVIKMLQVNEMDDMTNGFTVRRANGGINISFDYDRELNLVYQTRVLHYSHSLSLK